MVLTLAHLSDVHLGPLPSDAAWKDFAPKRIIGSLSWNFKRSSLHSTAISDALTADIKAANPSHVAFTGDLINVAALAEFPRAAQWMRDFGDPRWISFVPGNHDAYVQVKWEEGLHHLAPYMTGDMTIKGAHTSFHNAAGFPYVRLRRNLALIGLTSGEPQSPFKAGGHLGSAQLELLSGLLQSLKKRGYYRAVMIHHPPLPNLAPSRKALKDAKALTGVLQKHGAELVIHGHNHSEMLNLIDGPTGKIPIVGTPSASFKGNDKHDPAAWNLYKMSRHAGKWQTKMTVRSFDAATGTFYTKRQFTLPS